ncbi:hypothetical protein BCD67_24850 [Oscillatoriales cyanobacterium USR001]|nr:hypothetical protein BCD67_24850 [Oscillatoriales cyanobacterium USR001]
MAITGIIGHQGKGKTLQMTWLGLNLAMKYGKRLVVNYQLNIEYLEYFARGHNLKNLHTMIKCGEILFVPESIDYILTIPDSVVCLDEIAIFLGDSTEGNAKIRYLISRFNQCRRRGIELLYVAHSLGRVQKFLRDITNTIVFCDGKTKRTENGDPELIKEKYLHFDVDQFEIWFDSPKRYQIFQIFTKAKAFKIIEKELTCAKREFFQAFDSFSDIVNQQSNIKYYNKITFKNRGNDVEIERLPPKPVNKITNQRPKKKLPMLITILRKIVKQLAAQRTYQSNDYLRPLKLKKLWENRRKFSYCEPFNSKLITYNKNCYLYQSYSEEDWPKKLTIESIVKILIQGYLPAGTEEVCELLAKILGGKEVAPSDSILVRFEKMKF